MVKALGCSLFVLVLALPPAATAGTVTVAAGEVPLRVTFAAADGEQNDVTLGRTAPSTVRVVDEGAPLTAGQGCTQVDPSTADCELTGPDPTWVADVSGGDRDDVLRVASSDGANRLRCGPGQDTAVRRLTLGFGFPDSVERGCERIGGVGEDDEAAGSLVTDPVRRDRESLTFEKTRCCIYKLALFALGADGETGRRLARTDRYSDFDGKRRIFVWLTKAGRRVLRRGRTLRVLAVPGYHLHASGEDTDARYAVRIEIPR